MLNNEIIRITYKCNQKCKFCNVIQTNNFITDISSKTVINQILNLKKKYKNNISKIILSFSGWEPTLDPNLSKYISLAKNLWIQDIQIQTNWLLIYQNIDLLEKLYKSGLSQIFLALHSENYEINKKLGIFIKKDLLTKWLENLVHFKTTHPDFKIQINIVVTKINLTYIVPLLKFLHQTWFLEILPKKQNKYLISFWLVQPNWYAYLNKNDVLLRFNKDELKELEKIITFCEKNNIYIDFHYTAPPLCVLNYPNYNLEYQRLKNIKKEDSKFIQQNFSTFKDLLKEKIKFPECTKCKYNNYCLGFYKNFVNFVGKEYIKKYFLNKNFTSSH